MALFIVIELEAADSLYDPVPDPLQALRIYCVPVPPETGVVTPKVALVLELYQPPPIGDP